MTDECQLRQWQRQQIQEQLHPMRAYTSDRLHPGTAHLCRTRKL